MVESEKMGKLCQILQNKWSIDVTDRNMNNENRVDAVKKCIDLNLLRLAMNGR